MKTQSLRMIGCWATAMVIAACGGGSASAPPASGNEKAPPAGSAKAPQATSAPDAGAVAETPTAEAKTETTPSKKDEPKPTRPPHDVLTQKDTLFILRSAPGAFHRSPESPEHEQRGGGA